MVKSDTLQNLINFEACLALPRQSGGHDEQMKKLFIGATVLAHFNEGGYSGAVATAVRLGDGRFCWYQDSFGSCSGCDAWEDAPEETARKLLVKLAIDADIFDSLDEMLAHLMQVKKISDYDDYASFYFEDEAKRGLVEKLRENGVIK